MTDQWPGTPAESWPGTPVTVAPETADPSKAAAAKLAPPEPQGRPYLERIGDIPGDVMKQATEGVETIANAPSKILNKAENEYEYLIPHMVGKGGFTEESAREFVKNMQTKQGFFDVPMGAAQTLSAPLMGTIRAMGSRPIEESTGFPKEGTELIAGLMMGRPRIGRTPKETPTSGRLHMEADTDYKVARALPIQFMPTIGPDIANKIEGTLFSPRFAYREHTAKKTWKELEYLRSGMTNYYPTFADIDAARTSLGRIASKVDALGHRTSDAGAAAHAIDMLDKEMRNIQPNQVMSGAHLIPTLNETLGRARGNYSAYMRADVVEKAFAKAVTEKGGSGTGANYENKIRQAFGKILHNPEKAQRYTADELALFKEAAEGDLVRNAARYVGRAAPTGPVSTAATMGTGYLAAGTKGAATLGGIGLVSKFFADSAAGRAAKRAMEATRKRSPMYRSIPENPLQPKFNPYPMLAPIQAGRGEEEQ